MKSSELDFYRKRQLFAKKGTEVVNIEVKVKMSSSWLPALRKMNTYDDGSALEVKQRFIFVKG